MISVSNEQLQQQLEYSLIVTAGEFQKCNLDFRRMICNKIVLNLEKMPCDENWIYYFYQETEFPEEACWLSQTQEG